MVFGGEVWWPGTMLLFSPRWMFALPACLLIPYALLKRRLLMVPLICTLLIIFIPFMGLTYSTTTGSVHYSGKPMRVVTCNVCTGKFDHLKLALLIRQTAADMVALQECPPSLLLSAPPGWSIAQSKGFAVLSRFPLRGLEFVTIQPPGETWQIPLLLRTTVKAPGGDIAFCSLQLPTPRFGLLAMLDRKTLIRPARKTRLERDTQYRWQAARKLHEYAAQQPLPVILAGDFNTPVESRIFKQVWGGYSNAFSETGRGYGWTQRVSVSGLGFSARIDHVLTGRQLRPLTSAVGPDIGSDHLPLIADVGWVNGRE
jgi:hypothetical protein